MTQVLCRVFSVLPITQVSLSGVETGVDSGLRGFPELHSKTLDETPSECVCCTGST